MLLFFVDTVAGADVFFLFWGGGDGGGTVSGRCDVDNDEIRCNLWRETRLSV